MSNKRLLVICNAIDDRARSNRKIVTDSPAGTKKVFLMCKALRSVGVDARVISLGRGKTNKDGKYYRSLQANISGVPVYYLPFSTIPFLSQIITLIFATFSVFKYKKYKGKTVVMFYNRMPAYIGTLLMSRLLGFSRVLDLEDGETTHRVLSLIMRFFYDTFCNKGAILACSALKSKVSCRPVLCYYGVNTNCDSADKSWKSEKINFIFSGAILRDTGALLLINVIKVLREKSPAWAREINFIITGAGEEIGGLLDLQSDSKIPLVSVFGRLSKEKYDNVIKNTHVGLSLKKTDGLYSNSTFPSKIVEFSSNNMLVIATRICDVEKTLGHDGALYLDSDCPYDMIRKIKWVVQNKEQSKKIASQGKKNMNLFTDPMISAKEISDFLF
ncbi:MAG: glycosyl transferase group 1 [Bacteroidetes bacterium]|nr:glycosyl transferase group 1 [Bacteroidota bacterium]